MMTAKEAKAEVESLRKEQPTLLVVAERVQGHCARLRGGNLDGDPRGFIEILILVSIIVGVIKITLWCIDHESKTKMGLTLRARRMLRRWRNPKDRDNLRALKVIREQAPEADESVILAGMTTALPSLTLEEAKGLLMEYYAENQK